LSDFSEGRLDFDSVGGGPVDWVLASFWFGPRALDSRSVCEFWVEILHLIWCGGACLTSSFSCVLMIWFCFEVLKMNFFGGDRSNCTDTTFNQFDVEFLLPGSLVAFSQPRGRSHCDLSCWRHLFFILRHRIFNVNFRFPFDSKGGYPDMSVYLNCRPTCAKMMACKIISLFLCIRIQRCWQLVHCYCTYRSLSLSSGALLV
jgi:hypothetical protein